MTRRSLAWRAVTGGPALRLKGICKVSDYPPGPDGQPPAEGAELFRHLFPDDGEGEIDAHHAGTAIMAHSPRLALMFAQLSRFMALELDWSRRADLRELAFATLHLKLGAAYPFESRLAAARAAGLSAEQLALLPLWRDASVFDEEQRLVIAYTEAVVAGRTPDALFQRVVARFGEKGAVEFTALVGFWSCWAMILNAVRPD